MASRYIVRHGAMRFLGDYEAGEGAVYGRGQEVVVRSDRGLEAAGFIGLGRQFGHGFALIWTSSPPYTSALPEGA